MTRTKLYSVGTRVYGVEDSTSPPVNIEEYPLNIGLQFSLKMQDGNEAWVENISLEDFNEICHRKNLTTIEVLYFGDEARCFVVDVRVPRDWFRNY